jgi:hypothetical protein
MPSRTEAQISALGQENLASQGAIVELTKITVPYTTIVNRAQMVDLSRDMMPRFGIERVQIQQIIRVDGEIGPNGEAVYKPINDRMDQIRLAGNWTNQNAGRGAVVFGNDTADFMEITFYGTALNLLFAFQSSSATWVYSLNGGSETTFLSFTPSGILNSRNYAQNQVVSIVSGLTLGHHTVKIRCSVSPGTMGIGGFEILNTNSTIQLTPGSIFHKGRKLTQASLGTTSYNSGFEVGALGTKGGRVVLYKKSDGSTAKAVMPVDTSSATLTSTTHANEEVIRSYFWREFGCGRTDDFSTFVQATGTANRAFALDDGVTALVGNQVNNAPVAEGLSNNQASGSFITLTFVGTGLDIVISSDGNTRQFDAVSIDGGASIGALSYSASTALKVAKVVSGLPYGTHTVKFSQTSAAFSPSINSFIVYGPKKPTLPTGAVEIADYNILANYDDNTVAGIDTIAVGVLRKQTSQREAIYTGTWGLNTDIGVQPSGWNPNTITNGSYFEFTFLGTGFEARGESIASLTGTVQLQSLSTGGSLVALTTVNFGTAVFSNYASGYVLNSGTGNLTTTGSVSGSGFSVSNLPLGLYKLRITNTSTFSLRIGNIDIITPIHTHKNNGSHMLQNTLAVGSQSINDSRKFGTQLPKPVVTGQWTSGPHNNTVSTTNVFTASPYSVSFYAEQDCMIDLKGAFTINTNSAGNGVRWIYYLDGVNVQSANDGGYHESASFITVPNSLLVRVAKGWHTAYVVLKGNNVTNTIQASSSPGFTLIQVPIQ